MRASTTSRNALLGALSLAVAGVGDLGGCPYLKLGRGSLKVTS